MKYNDRDGRGMVGGETHVLFDRVPIAFLRGHRLLRLPLETLLFTPARWMELLRKQNKPAACSVVWSLRTFNLLYNNFIDFPTSSTFG